MHKALFCILFTIALDSIGVGLILPIVPGLLHSLSRDANVAAHYGIFLSLYALMQFVCSPVLGTLSDRFGRRPILLCSMLGAAVDYVIMANAPTLAILYLGRIISGVTGANMSVATAYIADISEESQRAKRYGLMNACFGIGFVIGPLLGGVLGAGHLHYPFLLAAALNGLNFLLSSWVLPESHALDRRRPVALAKLNPFSSLSWVLRKQNLLPLLLIFCVLHLVGQVPMSIWAIYTQDRYAWDSRMVGYSFAAFGICHALAQALLTGPVTKKLGERTTILLGLCADMTAFFLIALAGQGWMVFALIPFFCTGGIAFPALQALLSNRVDESQQGELQGTLVSLMSLASVIGPLLATSLYAVTVSRFPGTVWCCAACFYLLCLPVLFGRHFRKA